MFCLKLHTLGHSAWWSGRVKPKNMICTSDHTIFLADMEGKSCRGEKRVRRERRFQEGAREKEIREGWGREIREFFFLVNKS